MGKLYDELNERLQKFILKQKLFFVSSAPLAGEGLVNLSPKGFDTLRILDSHHVIYLDMMGSGVETVANLKENGRLVMMFCSFDEHAYILRLHGQGSVVEKADARFDAWLPLFPEIPRMAVRSFIHLEIERIADSCGWGVPIYEFKDTRPTYWKKVEHVGIDGIRQDQLEMSMVSLNGLPALNEPSV